MREVRYPSLWPKYVIIAAAIAVALAGSHVTLIAFAHKAQRHPGRPIRHVLSMEYARPLGVLITCLPVVSGVSQRGPAYDRWCRQWWGFFNDFLVRDGDEYIGGTVLAAFLAGAVTLLHFRRRWAPRVGDRRGGAAFSTTDELRPFSGRHNPAARPEAGALPMGTTVGDPDVRRGMPLALPAALRYQHVWVLGVTGSGKTTSAFKRWLAADALMDGQDGRPAMSSVIIDVKHPDISTTVAPMVLGRRRRFYVWAPFDTTSTTMAMNFLDYVPYPMDPQTAAALILSNMPHDASKDPFWRGIERQMLTFLIQMVTEEPEESFASITFEQKVRNVLNLRPNDLLPPSRSLAFVLALSYLSLEEFTKMFKSWPATWQKWQDRFATLGSADHRTVLGGMLGIQRVLAVFADPHVVRATSHSNFRLETIAEQPTTLVIGLPTQPRPNRQVLTALFLRQLLDVLGRLGEQRRPHGLQVPVSLYLDEIGTLGVIGNLPDYVSTYRDIKVSFVLSTQDSQQLVDQFGQEQAEVLIANLHTRVMFGHDLRPDQALKMSRELGERTVVEPTPEYKGGALSQSLSGIRLQSQTRPLMSPQDLRSMPPFHALVVLPGDRKAHVYMHPVHLDRSLPEPAPSSIHWATLFQHDLMLDKVIGPPPHARPAPAPAPVVPAALSPGVGHGSGVSGIPASLDPTPSSSWPPFQDTQAPSGDPSVPSVPAPNPAALQERQETVPDVPSPPQEPPAERLGRLAGQADGASQGPSGASLAGSGRHPGRQQTASRAVAPGSSAQPTPRGPHGGKAPEPPATLDLSGGTLTALFRALLAGLLRDTRVSDGTPGFLHADRREEPLVPWGYFTDFGKKAGLRFVDLNVQWQREAIVPSRATVLYKGQSVNCMVFSSQALQMLAEDLRQQVRQRFRTVSPQAVKTNAERVPERMPSVVTSQGEPAPSATGLAAEHDEGIVMTRNGAPIDAGSTPFLRECVEMIVARGAQFEGHPEYREGSPSIGRWRHVTRDGDDLLMVTRGVLDAFILGLGGNSDSVLGLWRSLGILRSSADNRLVYRITPFVGYIALRRSALFKAGFQNPSSSPTTRVSDATATG
ncbi:MAG: type IV secretory system conjugative DNA transfer family protein [bacterium]|nr:type IV secretory system conjugative DNA transfer family protein [bacterium]